MLTKMIEKEGISSYFKGNGVNVCRIFPFSAIELFTFEKYKMQFSAIFDEQNKNSQKGLYLLAGAASGITAATFVRNFSFFLFKRYILLIYFAQFLHHKQIQKCIMESLTLGYQL